VLLLSDNGAQFAAKCFQAICTTLGIKQLFASAYHPKCNGQTERLNRTVFSMPVHDVSKQQDVWDKNVAVHVFGYNTQVHSSTGLSPFELVLSRPPAVPILETHSMIASGKTKVEFRKSFLATVQELSKRTKEKLHEAQYRYKAVFDAHVRQRNADFVVGDLVFVRTYADPGGLSPKLLSPASGLYALIARTNRSFKDRTAQCCVKHAHVSQTSITLCG
jgi:transposase InsO family protein